MCTREDSNIPHTLYHSIPMLCSITCSTLVRRYSLWKRYQVINGLLKDVCRCNPSCVTIPRTSLDYLLRCFPPLLLSFVKHWLFWQGFSYPVGMYYEYLPYKVHHFLLKNIYTTSLFKDVL